MIIKSTIFSLLVVGVVSRIHEEPACSQYHFQERVLEKLVRLEHKMTLHTEKMTSLESEMKTEIAQFRVNEAKLLDSFTHMKDDATNNMIEQNNKISEALTNFQNQVARMSKDVLDTQANMSEVVDSFIVRETTKLEDVKGKLY